MHKSRVFAVILAVWATVVCTFISWPVTANAFDDTQETFERISNFNSTIEVLSNASLKVTEQIRVYANGTSIVHGIYRDFPTRYKDTFGNSYRVSFTVLGLTRDGQPEQYNITNLSNGKRVYFGDANVTIPTGFHTYTLVYSTNRQLGFFGDHDELYWNVTGNGWQFPIQSVTASVVLPSSVPHSQVELAAYTGLYGARGTDFTFNLDAQNIYFETLRALPPSEGFTIVVSWPKGFVQVPATKQKVIWFFQDNMGIFVPGLLLLLLFVYYLRSWLKHGIDPHKRTVVAQYDAPQGLSAASLVYVYHMGYRTKAFTAGILALAVKGYLHITNNDDSYTLTKSAKLGQDASPDEAALYTELFKNNNSITLSNAEYELLQATQAKQSKILTQELGGKYFTKNTKYFLFGLLLSVAVVISALILDAPVYATLITTAISLLLDILFYKLLRKRTPEGQNLYAEIEGFKLYMSVAEKDRLNFHNPPKQTPELFEQLLPFALALGVEHKWAEQFTSVFKRLNPNDQSTYIPLWYTGTHFNPNSISDFSTSFSAAISSSSTPPGSSSGGGGGGFSGGGGGGGGGGGW